MAGAQLLSEQLPSQTGGPSDEGGALSSVVEAALFELPALDGSAVTHVALPDVPLPDSPPEVAFVVDATLSESLCSRLVDVAEARGFDAALLSEDRPGGGYPDRSMRSCSMCSIHDKALADSLWQRLQPVFDSLQWDGLHTSFPRGTSGWRPCGINDRFRIFRYGQGDYFKPHVDGGLIVSDKEQSFLTVIIYLNGAGEMTGGGTKFHAMRSAISPSVVRPLAGKMLCFDHQLYHEGEAIDTGIKYIMRTDIVFARDVAEGTK
mmetsp:Transcript_122694/g.212140  ORF Transcript_122694/g.212140 Transcript_122694/m.212140 type:complete len:263 (+) Transcript_122694:59-847(+)